MFFVEEVAIDLILDFLRYIEQIHLGLLLVFDGRAIIHGSYREFGQYNRISFRKWEKWC